MAIARRGGDTKPPRARSGASTRRELCDLLRTFYAKGWISGTGGGICSRISDDELLLAPSRVHKERIRPGDLFVVDVRDGRVIRRPENPLLRPSECDAVFRAIIAGRDAGSVMHSHALSAVLAADLTNPEGTLAIEGFEMLKGIRGCSNLEIHQVPVIANTSKEPELAAAVKRVLRAPAFTAAYCIGVRDHGAYIWGADVWEAKRHAEVYHFLFEGVVARRSWLEWKR